jgi:hypothetical protein
MSKSDDNPENFKGKHRYVEFHESITPLLVKILGVKLLKNIGTALLLLGFLADALLLFSSGAIIHFINPTLLTEQSAVLFWELFYIFFGISIIGYILISFYEYYILTKCDKCNQDFAYQEVGIPDVTRNTESNGTVVTLTYRSYRCKYCGDEKSVTDIKRDEPISTADMV